MLKEFYKNQTEDIPEHLKINPLESNEILEDLKRHSRQLENYVPMERKYIKKKEKHLYFLRFMLNHSGDVGSDFFYALIKLNGQWYCFNEHRIWPWPNETIFKMSQGDDQFCGYDTFYLFYSQGKNNQNEMTEI